MQNSKQLTKISFLTVWFSRLVLTFVTLLFAMIAAKNLIDPVRANSIYKTTFGSPEAITNARVSFGALPLAIAIILFFCLISAKRHYTGLVIALLIDGLLTIVRILGIFIDGKADWTLRVLRPEIGLFIALLFAIYLRSQGIDRSGAKNGSA